MARKPNYDFERREREKAKAAKKEERAKAKAERRNDGLATALATRDEVNADQIAHWNSAAGERWAALHEQIDGTLAPVTAAVLAGAAIEPGSRILDIGCGSGATVIELAKAAGPTGRVCGIDVSEPMLTVARRRVEAERLDTVELLLADASTQPFEARSFDRAFSRFGVMFFDDPGAAFANIRSAMVDGGRIVFACWQAMAASSWFEVPAAAVRPLLAPSAVVDPSAPGPFAFADPDRVRSILDRAGFDGIEIEPHTAPIALGNVSAATAFVTRVGPTSRMIAEAEPDQRPALIEAVRTTLRSHEGPEGVVLEGAIWLVRATAGQRS